MNEPQSETPETDAESRRINFDNALYPTAVEGYKAMTKFARALELQRNESRTELSTEREARVRAERERDEARRHLVFDRDLKSRATPPIITDAAKETP